MKERRGVACVDMSLYVIGVNSLLLDPACSPRRIGRRLDVRRTLWTPSETSEC